MKLILGWLGICFAVLGVLSIGLQDQIPPEDNLLDVPECIPLTIVGVFFYVCRSGIPSGWGWLFIWG
ncbi:hypothetical protein [Marinobacter sp. CA1]|uniref:hypothetical protein n=1 Tax=Marinobacter sp. CA1 TaxID=2817656 RepID=UPI001D074BA4|nr:hypothetical protein [Marinobacter sp. CA1]UDL03444.1 hypothetical protein J2887_11825 [Marinobacter sp. CA1]